MTETNPFVHPAQTRLMELIDEAEQELFTTQDETQPPSDPMERFHVAREWGIDPWVAAMLPVSQELTTLQNLAVGIAPDEGIAKAALMSVVTHSLQALALFEEDASGDQALDNAQLADFLARLVTQLDARIDKLRAPAEQVEVPILEGEQELARGEGMDLDDLVKGDDQLREDLRYRGVEQDNDHSRHVHVTFLGTRPITTVEVEDVPDPGLAFTGPYGDVVAGEGPVQDPPAAKIQVGPHDEHDGFLNHADVLDHAHDGRTGRHKHDAWNLITWEGDIPPVGRGIIQVEEIPADQAGHDFRPEDPPVDLDGAERALARESSALRVSAGGSSAASLGGRHASPDDTDPDMGATARHAREE